jgi:hypothetical protein
VGNPAIMIVYIGECVYTSVKWSEIIGILKG